jgi:hypothetical protein
MRRILRNPWSRALLIWSFMFALLVMPLWPAASTPLPACNYPGAVGPDNGLPTCPPDNANYEAIGISLLVLLWLAGVFVGFIAFALSRFLRGRQRDSPSQVSGFHHPS